MSTLGHAQRVARRHLVDEVALAFGPQGVEQFARALQERAHHDAEMIGLLRNTIEAESLHTREAIAALRETVRDCRGNG